ncbi:MAG: NAD(P)-dependent oxidoreductase [Planctomycetes bacterium]|nr:NAD(P)-dependent oxidoreductase [Planctomycetota bacterium]
MTIEQKSVEGKKVLVVGGTGNIGRALCYVLSRNNQVDVLARFSDAAVRAELEKYCDVLWKRDLSHDSPFDGIPADYDYVFNMAVHWGFSKDIAFGDFDYFQRVNTLAGARLMFHFKDTDTAFVMGSTGGVYQPCPPGVARKESDLAIGGDNPYEISKIQLEWKTLGLSEMYDIPVSITRYFWPIFPWGGGGPARGTIARILRNQTLPKVSSPEGKRPMNLGYISDLTYATIEAAACAEPAQLNDNPFGCVYNISGPEPWSLEKIAVQFAELVGIDVQFEEAEAEGQHETYVADIDKMTKELYAPQVNSQQCLELVARGIKEEVKGPEDWMFEVN